MPSHRIPSTTPLFQPEIADWLAKNVKNATTIRYTPCNKTVHNELNKEGLLHRKKIMLWVMTDEHETISGLSIAVHETADASRIEQRSYFGIQVHYVDFVADMFNIPDPREDFVDLRHSQISVAKVSAD
jgi:hypothetical protein